MEATEMNTTQILFDSCKKKRLEQNQEIFSKIRKMFSDDKEWNSEDDMIKNLTNFHKDRNALRLYLQNPVHLITHSAKNCSVFPDVTDHVSASADQ